MLHGSSAANVPVKFQNDTMIWITNLAASRRHLDLKIRHLIEYWNGALCVDHLFQSPICMWKCFCRHLKVCWIMYDVISVARNGRRNLFSEACGRWWELWGIGLWYVRVQNKMAEGIFGKFFDIYKLIFWNENDGVLNFLELKRWCFDSNFCEVSS